MKHFRVFLYFTFALLLVFFAASCNGKTNNEIKSEIIEVQAVQGEEIDILKLENATGEFYEYKTESPSGVKIVLTNGILYLGEYGTYTVTHQTGIRWKISVAKSNETVVIQKSRLKKYFVGKTAVLPDMIVKDFSGVEIQNYDVEIFYNGNAISVENGTFFPQEAGNYELKVKVENECVFSQEIYVRSLPDYTVPANTTVRLSDDIFDPALNSDKNWDIEFKVIKNGETEVDLTNNSFVVESKSYFEVFATASESGNVESKITTYALYKASDLYLMTFNRTSDVSEYPISGTGIIGLKENGGNGFISVTTLDTSKNLSIKIPVKNDDESVKEGCKVRVSFDIFADGSDNYDYIEDADKWLVKVNGTQLPSGKLKAKAVAEGFVSGGVITLPYSVCKAGITFYMDNLRFEDIGNLPYSVEKETVQAEIGSQISLSADMFGLTVTDFVGQKINPTVKEIRERLPGGAPTKMVEPYNFNTHTPKLFEIDYLFTSVYDTTFKKTVRIAVGDFDIESPEVSFNDGISINRRVNAGTVIQVSPAGLGLSITDKSDFNVNYSIRKNGTTYLTDDSFTVNSRDYYDVTVTATDSNGNKTVKYLMIIASDCLIVTFDEMDNVADNMQPQVQYVTNQKGGGSETSKSREKVVLEGGNVAFSFTPGISQLSLNWVAYDIPAGNYDIQINFRFPQDSFKSIAIVKSDFITVLNNQTVSEIGITECSLWIYNGKVAESSLRFAFCLLVDAESTIYVDSITFTPVA